MMNRRARPLAVSLWLLALLISLTGCCEGAPAKPTVEPTAEVEIEPTAASTKAIAPSLADAFPGEGAIADNDLSLLLANWTAGSGSSPSLPDSGAAPEPTNTSRPPTRETHTHVMGVASADNIYRQILIVLFLR